MNRLQVAVASSTITLLCATGASAGEIIVNNVDADDVGFNDPTPAVPLPTNPGETIGQQRLNAYQAAADLWESYLQPEQTIVVQATFDALPCDADGGVLGAAGTIQVFANFEGAQWPETWSHAALSNHLAEDDLAPGAPDPGLLVPPFADDIVSFFNGDIDGNDECLAGSNWYYGLDNNPPAGDIDFLNVLMHELGHGLGFSSFIDDAIGQAFSGRPDVFSVFAKDDTSGKKLNQGNNGDRKISAINTGNLVWTGPHVTAEAPNYLGFLPILSLDDPASIFSVQEASYGAQFPDVPLTREVALYNDGLGSDVNDACAPRDQDGNVIGFPLDPLVLGKFALINRGSCAFVEKSIFAFFSGAEGVIITNNQPTGLPPMGGDPIGLPITSIGISKADGDVIKQELLNAPPAVATFARDFNRLSGANEDGFVRLYAPNPVEPGSSGSHFDVTASPNLLMEPFISGDLVSSVDIDLTDEQLRDIGWDKELSCPVDSDDRPVLEVGECDTGVVNAEGPHTTRFRSESQGQGLGTMNIISGCYLQDLVNACMAGSTIGNAESCLAGVTGDLVRLGDISRAEASTIKACL